MTDHDPSVLNLEDALEMDLRALSDRLRSDGSISIRFPLPCVGSTNDPSDIADDYMDCSFFAERLAPLCSRTAVEPIDQKYGLSLRFDFIPAEPAAFFSEFQRIVPGFVPDEELDASIRDEVEDFANSFFQRTLRVPELGDSFAANFLSGSRYLENADFWNEKFPTWKWGFWRSFASASSDCDFYTSCHLDGMWIVLGGRDHARRLLTTYGGFSTEGAFLADAASLRLNALPHLLATSNAAIRVPTVRLEKAVDCWREALKPAEKPEGGVPNPFDALLRKAHGDTHQSSTDDEQFWQQFARYMQHKESNWEYRLGFSWAMTENGDVVVCGDEQVTIVAFVTPQDRMRPEELRTALAETEVATEQFRAQLGLTDGPHADWVAMDDEQFEYLCYEVLIRCGRFDERTARKHGKARSRDGGRDIEIWTHARIDQPKKKWIFQCKHIADGRALSGSRVSVSDVIDQYSADGFGVMTNQVIDSTLYDRLDAIAQRRRIEVDTWDGLRLKRFAAARSDLSAEFLCVKKGPSL